MQDDGVVGLPASFQAAWGRKVRPTKGPRPGLSLERVVEAAVQLASSHSLDAVSMSRVASDLGASTMSLYRYVASKDELLELMIDAVYAPVVSVPDSDAGWRAQLSTWAWSNLRVLRKHPWVLRIPVHGYPMTPNQIGVMENGLRALWDTGLAESEKLSVIMLLTSLVRIHVTLGGAVTDAFSEEGLSEVRGTAAYGSILAQLAPAASFPALHAVIEAGVFDEQDHPDFGFEFVLERVLDGVEALVLLRAVNPAATTPASAS
ncbi:MAG: TetR/AcrR family transcriptional regulator [Hamadaea sp.]|uniref:TetR/AcrR family transcriptional regulator n=1 Tax=Hamadaea sp. TaxID=2024425 RepID=UPI0017DDC76F|nr:TetR/AcrR family transcriptional regulator [Hamadaea sp.]NUR69255.1 TetR/AcrR family transcriptional regulator [Hamadaea sp.]NUT21117.1 TetR/AcrR family transcriptional regulator [Hamadaea sp.]